MLEGRSASHRPMLELRSLRYQAAAAAEPVLRDVSLRLEPGRPALVAGQRQRQDDLAGTDLRPGQPQRR